MNTKFRRNIIKTEEAKYWAPAFLSSKRTVSKPNYTRYVNMLLELKEITPGAINKQLEFSNYSETTKKTIRLVYVSFLNWLVRNTDINFDTKQIKSFQYAPKIKDIYTKKQIEKLHEHVRNFGNKKFELYFHIIAFNSCRLSEALAFELEDLKKNNSVQIQARKGGKYRLIHKNEIIEKLLNEVDWNQWKKQTLSNAFTQFKKYVKAIEPTWNLEIKASQLRTQFITDASRKGMNSLQIQSITGHASTSVIESVYIVNDKATMEKNFKLAHMPDFDALNAKQAEDTYKYYIDATEALKRELEGVKEASKHAVKNALNKFVNLCGQEYGHEMIKMLKNVLHNATTKKDFKITKNTIQDRERKEQIYSAVYTPWKK